MNFSKHKKTTLINELTASTFSATPWSQKAVDVITYFRESIYTEQIDIICSASSTERNIGKRNTLFFL
jgi:hypothetical protein